MFVNDSYAKSEGCLDRKIHDYKLVDHPHRKLMILWNSNTKEMEVL